MHQSSAIWPAELSRAILPPYSHPSPIQSSAPGKKYWQLGPKQMPLLCLPYVTDNGVQWFNMISNAFVYDKNDVLRVKLFSRMKLLFQHNGKSVLWEYHLPHLCLLVSSQQLSGRGTLWGGGAYQQEHVIKQLWVRGHLDYKCPQFVRTARECSV